MVGEGEAEPDSAVLEGLEETVPPPLPPCSQSFWVAGRTLSVALVSASSKRLQGDEVNGPRARTKRSILTAGLEDAARIR